MIYLATPYAHEYHFVRQQRFEIVTAIAAKLMADGRYIFSPITHNHPIAEAANIDTGWDFWRAYDTILLTKCNTLMVVKAPGWQLSIGVASEIKMAKGLNLKIEYVDPCEILGRKIEWMGQG